jgi:hypothetical protein
VSLLLSNSLIAFSHLFNLKPSSPSQRQKLDKEVCFEQGKKLDKEVFLIYKYIEIFLVILNFTVPSRFSHEKYLGNEFVGIELPLILKIYMIVR